MEYEITPDVISVTFAGRKAVEINMNIIETNNLCYSYDGERKALNNMSIAFEKGKITSVLGSNGAGKSTLFLNLNEIGRAHV